MWWFGDEGSIQQSIHTRLPCSDIIDVTSQARYSPPLCTIFLYACTRPLTPCPRHRTPRTHVVQP